MVRTFTAWFHVCNMFFSTPPFFTSLTRSTTVCMRGSLFKISFVLRQLSESVVSVLTPASMFLLKTSTLSVNLLILSLVFSII